MNQQKQLNMRSSFPIGIILVAVIASTKASVIAPITSITPRGTDPDTAPHVLSGSTIELYNGPDCVDLPLYRIQMRTNEDYPIDKPFQSYRLESGFGDSQHIDCFTGLECSSLISQAPARTDTSCHNIPRVAQCFKYIAL